MIWSMLMFCALIHEDPTTAVIAPTDLSAYESARTKAGRDADAHVRLALWCESHGMGAERMKHLAMAVLYSPSHGLARGLMGLVACQGKWERPEIVGRRIEDDPAYRERIREYLELRSSTPRKPDAQARLAAWCEEKGLKEQSIAHYNEVVRLDPSREAAWKHLGYKKQGSRWVKPEDLAAERSESERQRHADKQWEPKLKRLREGLESKDSARRARAEAAIADVTDPRAVPMIWAVLFRGGERARLAAVQMLGQIDGPSASNALAALVLYNPSARVRARAAQSLNRRDPRDIVGRLVNLLRKPFKYEVKRVGGPGTVGELFLEGERFNIRRFYENRVLNPDALGMIGDRLFAPSVPFDPYSVQNQWMLFAANQGLLDAASLGGSAAGGATASHPQDAAAMLKNRGATLPGAASNPAVSMINDAYVQALYRDRRIATAYQLIDQSRQNLEQTLALDIQTVETTNTQISEINSRILPVLQTITGQNMGIEPEQWKAWWTDQLGYAYQSSTSETKRTYSEWVVGTTGFSQACFAAGTTVSTLDGPRAIESIQVGDRVLAQDTTTGSMAFQPVLAVHHNKPAPTLRMDIDGETIVTTGIHRFWKAGKGWTMARDLKPGDSIRVIGGVAAVKSVAADATVPVYNLDVAESRDFFVGTRGFLVHDFSFVHPVMSPFDASALVVVH